MYGWSPISGIVQSKIKIYRTALLLYANMKSKILRKLRRVKDFNYFTALEAKQNNIKLISMPYILQITRSFLYFRSQLKNSIFCILQFHFLHNQIYLPYLHERLHAIILKLKQQIYFIPMKGQLLQEMRRLKQLKQRAMHTAEQLKEGKLGHKIKENDLDTKNADKNINNNEISPIFLGYKFCIPIKDVELTPMSATYLKNQIQDRKGKVIEFDDFLKDQHINFVLCSRKVNIEQLLQKITGKLSYEHILDYTFVKHCMIRGIILGTDEYQLHVSQKQIEKIEKNKKPQVHHGHHRLSYQEYQHSKKIVQRPQEPKKQHFICYTGKHGETGFQTNKFIVDKLTELVKLYEDTNDLSRKIAYTKAANAIRNHPHQIKTVEDVRGIKGIGQSISQKIKELLTTGHLERINMLNNNQKTIAIRQLKKVWSVGQKKALQLYNDGIRSVEQLRKNVHLLNRNQKIGLQYYQQLNKRIPRNKVTKIFNFFKSVFFELVKHEDKHEIEVCGSYRRGLPDCGDIDIIITRIDGQYQKKILIQLVKILQQKKFLTHHLSQPRAGDDHSSVSYMGICVFQDKLHHRIDIKYYPRDEFAFALLYFTGSDHFNRSMRLFARRKGIMLSDKGFKQIEKPQHQSQILQPLVRDGQKLNFYTQRQIFEFLGLDYRSPEGRSI